MREQRVGSTGSLLAMTRLSQGHQPSPRRPEHSLCHVGPGTDLRPIAIQHNEVGFTLSLHRMFTLILFAQFGCHQSKTSSHCRQCAVGVSQD
jgi:hypothetical protein